MVTIRESGMSFGPFESEDCLQLEASPLYARIQQGTKMAEFALRRVNSEADELWIIEAKQSVPNVDPNPGNFNDFIEEIRDKLINGLHVVFAIWLKRHSTADTGVSAVFQAMGINQPAVRCILVIRGVPNDKLPPIQDAIQKSMRVTCRTLGLSPADVLAINDEKARTWRLIT